MRQRAALEWRHLPELYVSVVLMEDIMNVLIRLTVTVQKIVTECYKKTNWQQTVIQSYQVYNVSEDCKDDI